MLETTTHTDGATDDGGGAGGGDQRAVGELGFPAGGRAAPAGVPDPELAERAKRRTFTAKYKLEVLDKAEACTASQTALEDRARLQAAKRRTRS